MEEPAKPFACTILDCGMTFTNEDHLHVHKKKHDMVLQFGSEQKAAFVADQTPTPTRFIRNCEEVGLFQDLQNVNPFDEGFKRAIENKQCALEGAVPPPSSDDLHTPQMVFPDPGDGGSVYSTCNQRNITISRSSSNDSGAIKELETTTISKLTNEVTTIRSRIVEKHDQPTCDDAKDSIRTDVSYTNNVIKILSNVGVRNDKPITIEEDTVIKETSGHFQLQVPPIMSQQSIDNVVESLTADYPLKSKEEKKEDPMKDYEVILKLPSGKQIKLTSAEEVKEKPNAKDLLKKVLTDKVEMKAFTPVVMPAIPVAGGTLIPVSIVNSTSVVPKLPLKVFDKRPVKRKSVEGSITSDVRNNRKEIMEKESRKAASKRYRDKDKETKRKIALENNQLRKSNERLMQERTALKILILEHMKTCPRCDDFKNYFTHY